jgi:hypothetical protein
MPQEKASSTVLLYSQNCRSSTRNCLLRAMLKLPIAEFTYCPGNLFKKELEDHFGPSIRKQLTSPTMSLAGAALCGP